MNVYYYSSEGLDEEDFEYIGDLSMGNDGPGSDLEYDWESEEFGVPDNIENFDLLKEFLTHRANLKAIIIHLS